MSAACPDQLERSIHSNDAFLLRARLPRVPCPSPRTRLRPRSTARACLRETDSDPVSACQHAANRPLPDSQKLLYPATQQRANERRRHGTCTQGHDQLTEASCSLFSHARALGPYGSAGLGHAHPNSTVTLAHCPRSHLCDWRQPFRQFPGIVPTTRIKRLGSYRRQHTSVFRG